MINHKALKPPIEPLSERAWQRLEDTVIQRLRYSTAPRPSSRSFQPRMALLFAAVSLAVGVLAIAISHDGFPSSESEEQSGSEKLAHTPDSQSGSARSTTASAGDSVRVAEVAPAERPYNLVVVDTRSEAIVRELSGSRLTITPHSRVSYRGDDAHGWLVVVEEGLVRCEVAPRRGRPDFVVRAGSTEVRVVGTQFEVAYRQGQAFVSVDEGEVQVLDDGRKETLLAGEQWPLVASFESLPKAADPSRPAPKRPVRSPREDFELATSLEASDPGRALGIYRRLSHSGGPWAANALYAQARLLKVSGRDAEAQRLLSLYLQRYPEGTNAADAQRLLKHHPSND